jgi:hypothetical protein
MCEDYRMHRRGRVHVRHQLARFVEGDYTLVTRPGAGQDLLRGEPGFAESLLRGIGLAVELRGARTVYLIHHADCAAYRGFAFATPAEEYRQHVADMTQAADLIRRNFPGVRVVLLFAWLREGHEDRYVLRSVHDSPGEA